MKAKHKPRRNRVASDGGLDLPAIRTAVADYMYSEGCGCCSDEDAHEEHAEILGKLLRVQKYDDGSGRNFAKYRTKSKR